MIDQIIKRIGARLIDRMTRRQPDVVIGGFLDPYLYRWFVIPRNRVFNVYLHKFLRSDDDRALHDHPWVNLSVLLNGEYAEHEIDAGGVHRRTVYQAGAMRFRRSGRMAHRIELRGVPCWTLFVTGPRYREWGFHCEQRWIHWKDFTAADDPGAIGRGCSQ